MTAEWMPENPCDCENPNQKIEDCDMYCLEQRHCYESAIIWQKKLLEYLIATHVIQFVDIDGHTIKAMLSFHLELMLKQLEK
jgi:hypothetical protein